MERLGSDPPPPAFQSAVWTGWSDGGGAAEHLLLQLDASAVGLHHTTCARLRVSVYMCSQKLSQNGRRLDVSLLSRRLWPAGRDDAGKRGTGAASTIPTLRSYSDFTCVQPMDCDYRACLAWLALWPSWCDTGGPPSCFVR